MKVARTSNHFSLGPKTNTSGIEIVLWLFLRNSTSAKRNCVFIKVVVLTETLLPKPKPKPLQKYSLSRPGGPIGSPLGQPIVCHIKYSNCIEKVNWLLPQNSTSREKFSVIFSEQTWRAHGVASRATNCLPLFSRGAHGPRVSCNSSQLCSFWFRKFLQGN